MNELKHIAIIMDGNGRFAQSLGKPRSYGHKIGANVVREVTKYCARDLEITTLTLYAFSTENWKRPKVEVNYLMRLLKNYLKSERSTYMENNIRFRAIGDLSAFSKELQEEIKMLSELTSGNTALTQVLALNYGSSDEIARTIAKVVPLINQNTSTEEIKEVFKNNLDTAGLSDVDLLIRTAGEHRLSNFLLYQLSYSELFFTSTLWPVFSIEELEEIIAQYKSRHRRFGGL